MMDSHTHTFRLPLAADLAWSGGLTALMVTAAGIGFHPPASFYALAVLLCLAIAVLVIRFWPADPAFGWGSWATL